MGVMRRGGRTLAPRLDRYGAVGDYGYLALFSLLFLGILGISLSDGLLLACAGFEASHGAMVLH